MIVRFDNWTQFLDEITRNPPEAGIVNLTVSVRYGTRSNPTATIAAWYVSRKAFVVFIDPLIDQTAQQVVTMRSLFETRRRELEERALTVYGGPAGAAPESHVNSRLSEP